VRRDGAVPRILADSVEPQGGVEFLDKMAGESTPFEAVRDRATPRDFTLTHGGDFALHAHAPWFVTLEGAAAGCGPESQRMGPRGPQLLKTF
jgi:hypothetical protein